ncbi:hypothetical protein FGO68_gene555 [Halteria grandinella]|uniref:Uncharacterized protein n=1 Tax=Halteria grandinella TaxID=5974 RepID=A0A8J8SX74_HALGN|nr:hypothetical protein FGO68_gene555 [Halteria grandinella]
MSNIQKEKSQLDKDLKAQLKVANTEYTECISKDFLGRFLEGQKVSLENFCINERNKMTELDIKVYGQPLQL